MREVPGSEQYFPCDLCILALGFLGPEDAALKQLGVEQDGRSNIKTAAGKYQSNVQKVFAAGDCRRGQSLVVWGTFLVAGPVSSLEGSQHDVSRHQRGTSRSSRRGRVPQPFRLSATLCRRDPRRRHLHTDLRYSERQQASSQVEPVGA